MDDERRGRWYNLTGQKLSHIILFSLDRSSLHIFPLDKKNRTTQQSQSVSQYFVLCLFTARWTCSHKPNHYITIFQHSRKCAYVMGRGYSTPENVDMEWGQEGVLHNTQRMYTWNGGRRGYYTTLRECTKVHMGWVKEGGLHNTPENVHMGWGGEGVVKFMSAVLLLPDESDCRQLLLCWKLPSATLCRYVSVVWRERGYTRLCQ